MFWCGSSLRRAAELVGLLLPIVMPEDPRFYLHLSRILLLAGLISATTMEFYAYLLI